MANRKITNKSAVVSPIIKAAGNLAEQVDAVATIMALLANRMLYFAGFNDELGKHSREMAGAAIIARGWARAIRRQYKGSHGKRK